MFVPFIIGLVVGNMLCGKFSLSDIFHVSYKTGPGGGGGPSPLPTTTTTMVNFPEQAPAGLPAWPSGWKASSPVTPAQVERAMALLPLMSMGQVKYEQGPSGWEAYWKHKMGTKTGVTVHVPRAVMQSAPVSTSAPAAVFTSTRPTPPGSVPNVPVSTTRVRSRPTLRQGSKGAAVSEWQRSIGLPDDGSFGPNTVKGTKVWQSAHGLTPDGVVGPNTWATVLSS